MANGLLSQLVSLKAQKDQQAITGALDGVRTVLDNPDATPEAKEWAINSIQSLTNDFFHGGGGKSSGGGSKGTGKVGDMFKAILGGLTGGNPGQPSAGVQDRVAQSGMGRPQRMFLTPEEKEATRAKAAATLADEQLTYQRNLQAQKSLQEVMDDQDKWDRASEEADRLNLAGRERIEYIANAKGRNLPAERTPPVPSTVDVAGPDGKPFKALAFHQPDGTVVLKKINGTVLGPEYDLFEKPDNVTKVENEQDLAFSAFREKNNLAATAPLTATQRIQAIKDYNKEVKVPTGNQGLTGALGSMADAHDIVDNPDKHTPSEVKAAKEFLVKENRVPASTITAGNSRSDGQVIAEAIMRGEQPPDQTGLSRGGIWAEVRKHMASKGYNLTDAELDWKGTSQWVRTQNGARQTALRQATDFAAESLDLIDNPEKPGDDLLGELRRNVPRSKYPIMNKAALAAAKQGILGEAAAEAARNIDNQITDLQAEIATVYKGGNSPTDQGLKQAQNILSSDWSENTLRSAIKLARKNLQIRLNSIKNTPAMGMGDNQYAQPANSTPSPSVSDMITMRLPDGRTGSIHASQKDAFVKANPGALEVKK